MQKMITIALATLFLFPVAHAKTTVLSFDHITSESKASCEQLGITKKELRNVEVMVDTSEMQRFDEGFPQVVAAKNMLAGFHIHNYLGVKSMCGGYLSRLPMALNKKPYDIRWMSIYTSYAYDYTSKKYQCDNNKLMATIHITERDAPPATEDSSCVVILK